MRGTPFFHVRTSRPPAGRAAGCGPARERDASTTNSMKRTTLKALGIAASKDIPVDDIFSNSIDLAAYGLTKEDGRTLRALRRFVNEYMQERPMTKKKSVRGSRDAAELMYDVLRDLDHEEAWVLLLNSGNVPTGRLQVSVGGLDQTTIDCGRIVRSAIEACASGIILFHNHPNGSSKPSVADIKQTEKLKKMCEICDVKLLDHIIIAATECYSFSDESLSSISQ